MTREIKKWTTSRENSRRARFHHIHIFFLGVFLASKNPKAHWVVSTNVNCKSGGGGVEIFIYKKHDTLSYVQIRAFHKYCTVDLKLSYLKISEISWSHHVLVWYWLSKDQLTQSNPFLALLSHTVRSLGKILTRSSSRIGIVIKEEHLLAEVSAIMSSEMRRHCNHFSLV